MLFNGAVDKKVCGEFFHQLATFDNPASVFVNVIVDGNLMPTLVPSFSNKLPVFKQRRIGYH